jgi:hypothetical protein
MCAAAYVGARSSLTHVSVATNASEIQTLD